MLTVLLEVRNDDAEALAATLASLVGAAVDGYVREVVVLDGGMGPAAQRIADDAGCSIRPAQELADVVSDARADWLALFETGCALPTGWAQGLERRIRAASGADRGLRFRTGRWGMSDLVRVSRSRRLSHGVVARRQLLKAQFRIGMRLSDLAASIPTSPLDQEIVTAARRPRT